jgi:GNAT superfamily N-acetyltransferase
LEYTIVPLGNEHERNAFSCGEPVLDQYLQRYASQDIKRRLNRVFVAASVAQPHEVTGYYSLSAAGLAATDLPGRLQRRLPRYPLPVALIGRLAVAESHQGKGLGSVLLADALQRVAQASQAMAVHAVVSDALHDRAAAFYRHFGFAPLPDQPLKLFLPMNSVIGASGHRTRP